MLPEVDELATVVVCEDDEATLELLCDHLTADRYRALAAPSASDGLRLCHYKQPEALLLVAHCDSGLAPTETFASRLYEEGPGVK
jgi:DNA-binding response OmpR family regulator